MKMNIGLIISLISLLFITSAANAQENSDITVQELEQHVGYLASDGFGGRLPGTGGDKLSRAYIAGEFQRAGLELLADNGFQYFDVVTSVEAGENNALVFPGLYSVAGEDFIPLSFSKNGSLAAEVVFAGYGFQVENDSLKWDDYSGINIKDKWVVILRGEPGEENSNSPFVANIGLREKVLAAKDNGAGGVLFVSGPAFDEDDELMRMFYDKTTADAGIPVFHIKRYIADSLLGKSIASLEKKITDDMSPASFVSKAVLEGTSEVVHQKVQTANVVARIYGNDPAFEDEIVVIGGHFDHLGMGGPGSGSREPDTEAVHNGADDNASGVAGIIEMAEKIAANKHELKRTLVVVAFGAEEMGLIGSKYFVENPVIDMEKVVAMFNFDMIGRLSEERSIAVGGTGTSLETEDLLNTYLDKFDMKGSFSKEGFGPSDHASFYAEDIPVFFISTGAHQDYHTPQDDIEFINFEGQKLVADFSAALVMDVANRDKALTYQEAGAKTRSGGRMRFKVTLGIVPDFTSDANNGLGVGGVKKDGPAEKGGMQKGDIIVALDGMEVANIYDYMARLKKLEKGQIITVDVMRAGEKVVLLVQL
ncbi:MAG: M20/M25/M40 family metallo-hydrolase [Bacteroidota bacterium]